MKSRAVVMTKPGEVIIDDIEIPQVTDGGLILKVEMAGVCGSDKHMYLGRTTPKFPVIPGHEILGRVAEAGPSVRMLVVGGSLAEGDRVAVLPGTKPCGECFYCVHTLARPALCPKRRVYGFACRDDWPYLLGGYAEYMYVLPESWVYKIPDEMPDEVAVLLEPFSIALRAVERGLFPGLPGIGEGCGFGGTAVVIGCGTIGVLAVAALKLLGVTDIVALDLLESRLDMAGMMGATMTINSSTFTPEERIDLVKNRYSGAGADLVIECTGVPDTFAEGLKMLRRGGRLVEVGHYTDNGSVLIHPYDICHGDLEIVGSFAFPPTLPGKALALMGSEAVNGLPFEKIVSRTYALLDAEDAIQSVGSEQVLKSVITPWGERLC